MTARSSDRPPSLPTEPRAEVRRRRQAAALRANLERRRRFREARAVGEGDADAALGGAPKEPPDGAPVAVPTGPLAPRDRA